MIARIRAWWAARSSVPFERDTPAASPAALRARHVAFVREVQQLLTVWRELVDVTDPAVARRHVAEWPAGWTERRDVDGIEGPRTRAAARCFAHEWNALGLQRQLPSDGRIDAELLQSLRDDIERRIGNAP